MNSLHAPDRRGTATVARDGPVRQPFQADMNETVRQPFQADIAETERQPRKANVLFIS